MRADAASTVPRELDSGRYLLRRRLAQGGMAEVFLAVLRGERGFEKPIVIKVLRSGLVGQPVYAEMLVNEARLAARLNHPNIVQVIDCGTIDGRPFIAMELVAGQDLLQIASRARSLGAPLPVGLACRITAEVLAGLHHAHTRDQPLLHRDVSLQNVIVSYCGGVKLIDFGIAKQITAASSLLTRAGQWKGKFPYMSPEQIRHEVLDARSDVFSASVVLWELLTCRRLFRRESEFVTMRAVCNDSAAAPSTINPQVPGELDAIVHRGLAKSREERFSSAESMRLALEEVIWREQWRADASSLRALLTALFPGAERVDDETDHPGAPAQAGEPSSFDEEPTERELTPLDHPSPPLHTPAPARQCPPLSQEEEPTRVMPVPMSIGEPPFARAPLPPWPPPALACRSSGRMRVVLLATLLGLILAAVVLRSIG